jgi:hypothetical protein
MNTYDAFLSIAEGQMAAPVKARHRAAEKRQANAPTPEEKEQREKQALLRHWKRWHKEKAAALLEGPHGADIRELQAFVDAMTPSSSVALVDTINRAEWLRNAPEDIRQGVLTIVGHGIVKLRERHGMHPFDDALMDEPPTAFQQIREILR